MTKDPVIRLEIALEAINRECARLEREVDDEMEKKNPCDALVTYLETNIQALMRLYKTLSFKNTDAVDAIINKFAFSNMKGTVSSSVNKELASV
jgi:hypothetical protein